jgi:hypothetical protein
MLINRSWRELRVMLQRRFPFLKDEEFVFEEGNKEKVLAKLAVRLQKSRSDFDLLLGELQRY